MNNWDQAYADLLAEIHSLRSQLKEARVVCSERDELRSQLAAAAQRIEELEQKLREWGEMTDQQIKYMRDRFLSWTETLLGVAPQAATRRSATTGRCSYTVPAETPRRGR